MFCISWAWVSTETATPFFLSVGIVPDVAGVPRVSGGRLSTSDADYQMLLARTQAQSAKAIATPAKKKQGKVPHTPVTADGYTFDSKAEYKRYVELCWLVKARIIRDLKVHTVHELVVNGEQVGTYEDDFSYWITELTYQDGKRIGTHERFVCEDVKSAYGRKDKWFRRAKKLMVACKGITISEVIR
jgi:hypothetical protein